MQYKGKKRVCCFDFVKDFFKSSVKSLLDCCDNYAVFVPLKVQKLQSGWGSAPDPDGRWGEAYPGILACRITPTLAPKSCSWIRPCYAVLKFSTFIS